MTRKELEARTRRFHIGIIRVCRRLPKDPAGYETGRQLIRAGGSVGANYRASGRAKSDADFHYKIKLVLEEADESEYWLGVVKEAFIDDDEVNMLLKEAGELVRIFSAAELTLKGKRSPDTRSPDTRS